MNAMICVHTKDLSHHQMMFRTRGEESTLVQEVGGLASRIRLKGGRLIWEWQVGEDIYIMMQCLCVTKNEHSLLGVSCNHLLPSMTPPVQLKVSFHGSMSAFIGFQGLRLVFHGSRSVFMGFQGSRLVFRGSSRWIFISAGTRQLNNRRLIKYLK